MSEDALPVEGAPTSMNPVHVAIAENVRTGSRSEGQPIRLEITTDEGQPLSSEAVLAILGEIEAIPEYSDIRHMALANGEVYVYSRQHITDEYARLCARILKGDHPALIAATVREESERYPRPTPARVFLNHPFHLTPQELEATLQMIASSAQFSDVRSLNASTKAIYLYSDRFLNKQYASALMEWEEVGRYQNP